MNLESLYHERLRSGILKPDSAQERVVLACAKLAHVLNTNPQSSGIFRSWFGRRQPAPRGLYIHGEVGRGKTMIMDMFFESITRSEKCRVHFHAFMQDVHGRRAALKEGDVITAIAESIARNCKLLCLDETQIVDIADAMIIGRLFDALDQRGVCFVTTSNLPPEELYKDGLNRQLFLPFIARLRERLEVISLDSLHDYRLGRIKSHETYIVPLGPASTSRLDRLWRDLTDGDPAKAMDIDVLGRTLHVPQAAHGCARFSFSSLCERPLGPPDYLAITKAFRTVFIDDVPIMSPDQRNEAKRFVLMIDTFYDASTRLVLTAEAEPEKLYPQGKHGFEFRRTVSRLKEMQSASWWGKTIPET